MSDAEREAEMRARAVEFMRANAKHLPLDVYDATEVALAITRALLDVDREARDATDGLWKLASEVAQDAAERAARQLAKLRAERDEARAKSVQVRDEQAALRVDLDAAVGMLRDRRRYDGTINAWLADYDARGKAGTGGNDADR